MITAHDPIDSTRTATGPRTAAGKEISRRNSMSHGLSGSGAVIPEEDVAEVNRRAASFVRDLGVTTELGRDLVRQMAVMSVRMDRCTSHEFMSVAHNRRGAIDCHDDARQDEADRLFEALGDDPAVHLRKLRRMPEGCDRLIEAWKSLRGELTRPRPRWTAWHRDRAEHLTGNRPEHNPYTPIADLSEAIWGDSQGPLDEDDHAEEASKAKGRARMIERIDAELAALEAHITTLDHDSLELDRLESPDRAMFDDSKAATLARRYEAEASRRYFKLLARVREVEAEAAERPPAPAPTAPLQHFPPAPPRSFRETPRQEPYAPIGGFGGPASRFGVNQPGQDGAFAMTATGGSGPPPARE